MRLKKIKLAGFKSFVDPTTILFKSELVGVVGPNGCGKSNVIDAVRWVLGESSAKNLRGASMTDVIFNGSSSRKPVGQASVELCFDNLEGKLGGEYAAYAEIEIRREVTRDGQSSYYLNNTKCRRKDILEVFLGTGLGPRSYSIIEQGMITRVIEAKPEDLRAFVEEAAGISVYKKRRHDTELRMRHTKENLERIGDLRQEQEKTLEKLKRQSADAKKFKEFNQEKDKLESYLAALQWKNFDEKSNQYSEDIRNLATELEKNLANRASIDLQLETFKVEEHNAKSDLAIIQEQYYEQGSQIARLEESISHHSQIVAKMQQDLSSISEQQRDADELMSTDQAECDACQAELEQVEPNYQQALHLFEESQMMLEQAQQDVQAWNQTWLEFQQETSQATSAADLEKVKIDQFEKESREFKARIDRLNQEMSTFKTEELTREVLELEQKQENFEERYEHMDAQVKGAELSIATTNEELTTINNQIYKLKEESREIKGRLSSLEVLQQASLGSKGAEIGQWLTQHNLDSLPRLAEELQVASGWEKAVEVVLSEIIDAVYGEINFATIVGDAAKLTKGRLCLITKQNIEDNIYEASEVGTALSTKVTCDSNLAILLCGIYACETIEQANQLLPQLHPHESCITADGVWLGFNWIKIKAQDDTQDNIFLRKQEIQAANDALEVISTTINELELSLSDANDKLQTLQLERADYKNELKIVEKQLRDNSALLSKAQASKEHMQSRASRIENEQKELVQQIQDNAEQMANARANLEILIKNMANTADRREELTDNKQNYDIALREANIQLSRYKEELHAIEITKQTVTTKFNAKQEHIQRLKLQQDANQLRYEKINQQLNDALENEPKQSELEKLLAARLGVEEKLSTSRDNLQHIETTISELDNNRREIEQLAVKLREHLDKLRMERQALEVRQETIAEKLQKLEVNLEIIMQEITDEMQEPDLENEINVLANRIARLGAINLAAIDEYESELERSLYLESQFNDLNEALETLENAIAKIDKETKQSFKANFDLINKNFQVLFPKLFGGGQAILELVGDDMLDAGVTVIARPPGKKNSSIHLLSGGEKALTAVSLVFSIFQLNPAPFCMLDEVDAPLDDANVGRYSQMIKEMSSQVQFIFITHNKLTMEIANQLCGVTMKEPGVSRLVAVDIEEAFEMATT